MSRAEMRRVGALDWARDGRDWPLRAASRFVFAGGLRWHVQRVGQGLPVLLVHGTGATTHSFRALIERLSDTCELVAFDLPGHGFTDPLERDELRLEAVASLGAELLAALEFRPRLVVGHSAGAAVLCRMALDGYLAPQRIVSLNGALRPYWGRASRFFTALARGLAGTALPAQLVAQRARSNAAIELLLQASGSRVPSKEISLYRRVASSPEHVRAALRMMAGWDLVSLWRDLPELRVPLSLIVGDRDRFVPPSESEAVLRHIASADRIVVPDAGHLMHEERPDRIAALIRELSAARAPRPSSR